MASFLASLEPGGARASAWKRGWNFSTKGNNGRACCGRVSVGVRDTDATLAIATAAIAPGAREVPVRRQPPVLRRQWLVLSVFYITPLGLSSVQGYVRGTTSR